MGNPNIGSTRMAVAALVLLSASVHAQEVSVKEAWIRGTVPGQSAAGAFMELTGKSATRLVGVTSPVAKIAEVHRMKMENGVMKMFPVSSVDIPAGKTVKFAPGAYHVMLMDLQKPLNAGDQVPLKLTFELANKQRITLDLTADVRDVSGKAKAEAAAKGHHGH